MLTEENHGKPLFSESSQEIHSLYPPTVMMGKISFSWWIAIFHHVWLLNHMCFTHSGWWFQPLWKIWVRQLGSWHSQYMENHKSHVPVTTKQHLNHFWVPSGNLTVRYWKWWFSSWIFPLKMVDLSIVMLNYQRVNHLKSLIFHGKKSLHFSSKDAIVREHLQRLGDAAREAVAGRRWPSGDGWKPTKWAPVYDVYDS